MVDRPTPIVHVPTPGDHFSGATGSAPMTIIYELAREHDRRGGTTRVIVGHETRHDYPVGEIAEVRYRPLPDGPRKAADAFVGRIGLPRPFLSRTYRPGLHALGVDFDGHVLVHNSPGGAHLFARRLPSARVTLYAHNDLFRTYGHREARSVVSSLHRVLCVSSFIADGINDLLGYDDDRLRVVHNGVDTERFMPCDRAKVKVPVILFVGRVVPEKGPDLLLKAAGAIARSSRPFRIRIVGSSGFSASDPLTPYERHLRELARPLGPRVEFQPFLGRDRIAQEYERASIFCVPSTWNEPCSLTVPEGMAAGLPVVASSRGGIPEVGGDAVLYFRPPDISELVAHLTFLLESSSAREEWGARARRRAEAFSWSTQYEAFADALAL